MARKLSQVRNITHCSSHGAIFSPAPTTVPTAGHYVAHIIPNVHMMRISTSDVSFLYLRLKPHVHKSKNQGTQLPRRMWRGFSPGWSPKAPKGRRIVAFEFWRSYVTRGLRSRLKGNLTFKFHQVCTATRKRLATFPHHLYGKIPLSPLKNTATQPLVVSHTSPASRYRRKPQQPENPPDPADPTAVPLHDASRPQKGPHFRPYDVDPVGSSILDLK